MDLHAISYTFVNVLIVLFVLFEPHGQYLELDKVAALRREVSAEFYLTDWLLNCYVLKITEDRDVAEKRRNHGIDDSPDKSFYVATK